MCTLSWLADGAGFAVFFNRDERRTRAPAVPPARGDRNGVATLAPVDGDFGGTWIGVNSHAVVIALLNRYHESPTDPGPSPVSRGILVASSLDARSAEGLIAGFDPGGLAPYAPFTLCATDRVGRMLVADWTGAEILRSAVTGPGMVRTSSGRDQRLAEEARSGVWAGLAGDGPVTRDLLDRFHRSHLPEPGPFSVCMHREEAVTRSLSIVEVGGREARFTYVDGPPGETERALVTTLGLEPATT